MPDNAPAAGGFRIDPTTIPQLQKAFQDALAQLRPVLQEAGHSLPMASPAMADEASTQFQAAFNQSATQHLDSLTAFEQRLNQVLATLGSIQRAYDSNDQDTARNLAAQLGS
ncbi:PE domain-containing protein [Pseudonocardia spinosispora]|uniref:PE domain-containing protein n=1 Tax=Pseudonocardia spinosispora TaxID=103441 RepID=UPI0004209F2F|nr:PE domain-containing protein [Pseudonocardia spinosispora]